MVCRQPADGGIFPLEAAQHYAGRHCINDIPQDEIKYQSNKLMSCHISSKRVETVTPLNKKFILCTCVDIQTLQRKHSV